MAVHGGGKSGTSGTYVAAGSLPAYHVLEQRPLRARYRAGVTNHPPSVLAPGFCLFSRAQRRFAARASFFLAAGLIVRLALPPDLELPDAVTRRLAAPSTAERISAIFSSSSAARRSYPTSAASNNSRPIVFGISANYNWLNTTPSSCLPYISRIAELRR